MRFGPYEVVGEIARGGMGVVYRARNEAGDDVAVKALLTAGDAQRRRFQREARALATLTHPQIVRVFAAGEQEGRPWMAMQLVEGESLQQRLERRGPLEPDQAAALVATLADTVQYCHDHRILHRDLKPDNVLLDGDRPVLTDFGLVKDVGRMGQSTIMTVRGCFIGTPGFWSPEQVAGDPEAIGPAADVYGLGAILYALLTGRPPIEAHNLIGYIQATQQDAIQPTGTALDPIVLRCLEKRPSDRYPSAAALASELRGDGAAQAANRRPATIAAVAAVVALALVALGLGLRSGRAPAPAPSPPVASAPAAPAADAVGEVSVEAALARGDAKRKAGDFRGAIAEYNEALLLDPKSATAYLQRGFAQRDLGDHREAAADFRRALKLDRSLKSAFDFDIGSYLEPPQPVARRAEAGQHARRGRELLARGAYADAIQAFTRAIAADPNHEPAYAGRGHAKVMSGERAGGIDDLTRAIKLQPRASSYNNRGFAKAVTGGFRAALPDYDAAIRIEPGHFQTRLNRGFARKQLRDFDGALVDYERASKIDPGNAEPFYFVGMLRRLRGDHARAASAFQRARKLNPNLKGDPRLPADIDAYVREHLPKRKR